VSRRRKLLIIAAVVAFGLVAGDPVPDGPKIDRYQPYVANDLSWRISLDPERWETNCDESHRVEQPGVQIFRDMTLTTLGGGNGAIFACSHFEHEQGRAWDWMNDVNNPQDVARVQAMLDWLLAPDSRGVPQVMARRVGLAYIIWNKRIVTFYGKNRGWRPYYCEKNPTPGNCHTNHVHFAFSWAAAKAETSWFTVTPRPDTWYPTAPQPPS
jgi:hypothetical protein